MSSGTRNPELIEDPYYTPQLSQEIDRYFSELEQIQRGRNRDLHNRYSALTPPTNDVHELECIAAIPVAGHQEHGNIYRTLQQFAKQDLNPGKFEVFLYLNVPGEDGSRDNELALDLRQTQDEIARFRRDYPGVSIRTVTNTYRGSKPTIGTLRSDLWELVGLDMKTRGRTDDILVLSSDADIVNLNKQYLSSMVDTWKQTGADVVTANLVWQSVPNLPYDATVNRLLRYQTFLDNLRDNHATLLHTSDANTAISLAMYFAVGGYERDLKLGEMSNLVSKIRYYRWADKGAETYVPVKTVEAKSKRSYLKTHSRRLIKAMSLGHAPYEAWDQRLIEFGNNDELRTAAMESAQAEIYARQYWKKWLTRDTPQYTREVPLAKKRRVLRAARHILGFADLYE